MMKDDEGIVGVVEMCLYLTSSIDLLFLPQVDLAGSEKAGPVESQEVGSPKNL